MGGLNPSFLEQICQASHTCSGRWWSHLGGPRQGLCHSGVGIEEKHLESTEEGGHNHTLGGEQPAPLVCRRWGKGEA